MRDEIFSQICQMGYFKNLDYWAVNMIFLIREFHTWFLALTEKKWSTTWTKFLDFADRLGVLIT